MPPYASAPIALACSAVMRAVTDDYSTASALPAYYFFTLCNNRLGEALIFQSERIRDVFLPARLPMHFVSRLHVFCNGGNLRGCQDSRCVLV